MARVAKQDTGRLSAISEARARYNEAVKIAKEKVQDFIREETEPYQFDLIDAVRLALLEGHSARQIGQAYGTTDPYTIRRLIEQAGISDDVEAPPAWRVTKGPDGYHAIRVVAFGPDRVTGEATFTIDEDGENITVTDGDLWLQSVIYREGIVKEVVARAR